MPVFPSNVLYPSSNLYPSYFTGETAVRSISSKEISEPKWKFFLAKSNNFVVEADITEAARDKNFNLSLNRPGSFEFNLPFNPVWDNFLNPIEYCVLAYKHNILRWSGPIWTREDDFVSKKYSISTVGWFELLRRRIITDIDKAYTNKTDGFIAFDLLNYANSQVVQGSARPTWITAGSNTSSSVRTITIPRWANIGEEIERLTEIEAGFDFEIDPLTREMNIKAWDDYNDNVNTIFSLNWGPDNLVQARRKVSADDLYNDWYVQGQTQTAHANDTDSSNIDKYNLHQNLITLGDFNDLGILAAIANVETEVNKFPRVTIDFSPKAAASSVQSIPSLYEDYKLGDKVYLTIDTDSQSIIYQPIRIFGVSFSIDNSDIEKVSSIQTTYQSG